MIKPPAGGFFLLTGSGRAGSTCRHSEAHAPTGQLVNLTSGDSNSEFSRHLVMTSGYATDAQCDNMTRPWELPGG
ncbi:MAG: hypothetical protein IPJ27_14240 [Candidatus Accumulibacter sp.]|uniref:Uncharacterized protein n=1 Tax=Candidatus Accumulibacter proximus TaxID=2954385 RepID=A0A935Q0L7_9PROT|nr:hypothetical protein [Candidatus Accumulibacter proximus]